MTYVPFRNAHFLSAAVSWAEVLGAERIYIGAVQQDSSGYPDCRPEFYQAFNEVIRTGTKEGRIRIETPLIALRKREIVTLGLELGAPFDLTWSCYSRDDQACGSCDSCVLRLRAFAAAGAVDPIPICRRLQSGTFHEAKSQDQRWRPCVKRSSVRLHALEETMKKSIYLASRCCFADCDVRRSTLGAIRQAPQGRCQGSRLASPLRATVELYDAANGKKVQHSRPQ